MHNASDYATYDHNSADYIERSSFQDTVELGAFGIRNNLVEDPLIQMLLKGSIICMVYSMQNFKVNSVHSQMLVN